MLSSPDGPVQDVFDAVPGCGRGGQESSDFVAGQPDQPAAMAAGGWGFGGGHHGEERVSEDRQGAPALPGGPGADLVLVQGDELFACGEGLLDRPAASGDLDQGGQRDRSRAVGAVEGVLTAGAVAAEQQPVVAAVTGGGVGGLDQGPVVPAFAFRAEPGRQSLPGPCG